MVAGAVKDATETWVQVTCLSLSPVAVSEMRTMTGPSVRSLMTSSVRVPETKALVFADAGTPPGVVNMVTALDPKPIGEVFTNDPRVRKLTFTGSTAVGRRLAGAAAGNLKRVSVELGGHAPFVVFPDAEAKFFLDASCRVRAERRHRELLARGEHSDVDEVEREIARRDQADRTRPVSPLCQAPDAVVVNTDGLDAEQVARQLVDHVTTSFPLTFN